MTLNPWGPSQWSRRGSCTPRCSPRCSPLWLVTGRGPLWIGYTLLWGLRANAYIGPGRSQSTSHDAACHALVDCDTSTLLTEVGYHGKVIHDLFFLVGMRFAAAFSLLGRLLLLTIVV